MTVTLEPKACHKIAEDLNQLLSDTFVLYVKTLNYHWNVEDPRFSELHALFERQYQELQAQADEIAERTRMLGEKSQGTMREFLDTTTLAEGQFTLNGDEMLKDLALDHQAIAKWLREKIPSTQELGDEGTADLYIQQLRQHDKQAWMLLSHLKRK